MTKVQKSPLEVVHRSHYSQLDEEGKQRYNECKSQVIEMIGRRSVTEIEDMVLIYGFELDYLEEMLSDVISVSHVSG